MARAKENGTTGTNGRGPTNLPLCGDGCGKEAAKGRRFLPGHDARLASLLQSVADGRTAPEDMPALVQADLKAKRVKLPQAKLETHEIYVSVLVTQEKGAGVRAAERAVTGRLALRSMHSQVLAADSESMRAVAEYLNVGEVQPAN